MESDEIADLLEQGQWVQFAPGEVLMEQGQSGDAFYAIRTGQVRVIRDGETVATLGPGSYVGEIALLFDIPRTATVVAHTPVRAYRLEREGFDRLVANSFRRGTLRPNVAVARTMEH
jgi:cAMP-dependent protein kinase regulator